MYSPELLEKFVGVGGGWRWVVVVVAIWELSVLLWSKPFTFKLKFGPNRTIRMVHTGNCGGLGNVRGGYLQDMRILPSMLKHT